MTMWMRMKLSDRKEEVVVWRPQRWSMVLLMLLGPMLIVQVSKVVAENQSVAGTTPRSTLVAVGQKADQLGPVTQATPDHLSSESLAGPAHQQAEKPEKQPPQTSSESSSDEKKKADTSSGQASVSKLETGAADKSAGAAKLSDQVSPAIAVTKKPSKKQARQSAHLKQGDTLDQRVDEERSATNQVVSYADSPSSTVASARWQVLQQEQQTPPAPPALANQLQKAQRQQPQQTQPQPQPQAQAQPLRPIRESNSNRWTHFGARLKPLAGGGSTEAIVSHPLDHAGSASTNARSRSAYHVAHASTPSGSVYRQRQSSNPSEPPASSPEVDSAGDADQDDGPDSEALLYKMMQQPGNMLDMEDENQDHQVGPGKPTNNNRRLAQSDRVMKLLKSYSHIHQVDDSDDQIRGAPPRPRPQQARGPQYHMSSSGHDDGSWRGGDWKEQQQAANRRQPLQRNSYNDNTAPEVDNDDGSYNPSHDEPPTNGPQQSGPAAGDQAASAPDEEFECPNNGIFADEASGCQYYHVCQSGAQLQEKFQCPMGTLFNNLVLTCDFAHNVQCGKKPKQRLALPEHPSYQPSWQDGSRSPAVPRSPPRVSQPRGEPRTLKIGHAAPSARRYQQMQPTVSTPINNEIDGPDDDGSDDVDDEPPTASSPPPSTQAPVRRQFTQQNIPPQTQYKRIPEHQSYMNRQVEFDGASVTTPVFASRDEGSLANVARASMIQSTPAIVDNNSFNLVINHLTTQHKAQSPVKPQQYPHQQHSLAANNAMQTIRAPQESHQYSRDVNYLDRGQQNIPQSRQQVTPSNRVTPTALYQTAAPVRQPVRQPSASRYNVAQPDQVTRQYQQHLVASSGRQEPSLIDLTNDRRQQVSSAALNDGLVLLVRHDTAPAPVFKAARHAPTPATGGARAFAVDPRVVRPDSPLDSQLFPNVQTALVPGKAAHVSRRMVAAHLPRVEPPKPQQKYPVRPHHTAASNQVSQIASAPIVAAITEASPKQVTPQQRVRRAKKVRQLGGSERQRTTGSGLPAQKLVNSPSANNTTASTSGATSSPALVTPLPQVSTTTLGTTSFTPIPKRPNKATPETPRESSSSSASHMN